MDEQTKWLLDIKSTPSEDSVKIVEMTTKDLESFKFRINLVEKAGGGLERITSSLKEALLWVKRCQRALLLRESFCERKSQMMWQISLLSYFQKLCYPPKPSATTTLISQ